jgi:ABC-type polysaccharide/polyol phosphate export permease
MGILFFPLILLIQLTLLLGLGIGASALNVFYRDVDPLLKLVIQVWFYASPILYPITLVPDKWQWLYYFNPMAGIIASYRDTLLYNRVPGNYLIISALVSLVIFFAGCLLFKRTEFQFADIV